MLVRKNIDKTLATGIPDINERHMRSEINKADIIRKKELQEIANKHGLELKNTST